MVMWTKERTQEFVDKALRKEGYYEPRVELLTGNSMIMSLPNGVGVLNNARPGGTIPGATQFYLGDMTGCVFGMAFKENWKVVSKSVSIDFLRPAFHGTDLFCYMLLQPEDQWQKENEMYLEGKIWTSDPDKPVAAIRGFFVLPKGAER